LGLSFLDITLILKESFSRAEIWIFDVVIILMFSSFVCLIALIVPSKNFTLAKKIRKKKEKVGHIFGFYDISTYDIEEYLEALQEKQVIAKNKTFTQGELSQSASIIFKAYSTHTILELMILAFYPFITWIIIIMVYCFLKMAAINA
jgi:hypothetical protein